MDLEYVKSKLEKIWLSDKALHCHYFQEVHAGGLLRCKRLGGAAP